MGISLLFRIIIVLPLFGILIDYGEGGPTNSQLWVDAKKNRFVINNKVGELDYANYLLNVFDLLKYEPGLGEELNEENIKVKYNLKESGKLGEHLDKIHEDVRTQLDELKRLELYRVRQIGEELKKRGQYDKEVKSTLKAKTKHLDLKQMSQFSSEDLRKLLLETNAQLALLDEERRERFKEYEMHKLLEFEELLKRLSPLEQMEVRAKMDEMLQTHVRQKPIHMPASKQHLLKVWEEKDKMEKENFNVKTFFHLHDLDGNGFMDEYEIKMLLKTQVLDHYDETEPDFDEREMNEEMERMREYAFTVIDTDKDHLVSLEEFIVNSKKTGFEEHLFWENVKAVPLYTEEEYQEYVHANQKEVNRMIDEKLVVLDLSGIVQHIIKDAGKIMKKRFNL